MIKIEKRPGKEVTKDVRDGYISGTLASTTSEEKLKQIASKLL